MDSKQIIQRLLKEGENEQLEFKETVRKDDLAKVICSFLNVSGGQILVGIRDDKEVIGVTNAEEVKRKLEDYLIPSIAPNAPVSISIEKIQDKDLLLIKTWRGTRFPYTYDSSIYYREGNSTRKATAGQISELIEKRQDSETLWERQTALGAELDDLDSLSIKETLDEISRTGRGKSFDSKEIEDFLTYYGLYGNGKLTNAAIILYAKEPQRFLPQSRIRLTVFKSDKAGDEFLYDRFFEGNLFKNVENITEFFDVNIGVSSHFNEKDWKRKDRGFPRLGLREGLLNALIHSDYSNSSSNVSIGFYSDRLEIMNAGELPLKLSELKKNHLSLPRNPDVAHICFLREWIEKIGRGTLKIIDDCVDKGFPEPIWKKGSGITTLVFPEITVAGKYGGENEGVIEGASEGVNKETVERVIEGVSKGVSKGVKEKLALLLKAIIDNEGKRVPEYEELTQIPKGSVERYIARLRKAGLIEFSEEATKVGGYYITSKLRERIDK